ncbi:DMT family transporter [Sulfitobacter sp. S0837]|uniref:DMT family transporter n=1 Tax=Sulfitobacter maritimus TaxID=2741719 RepID=UPI0015823351|nr:DMT family transporter [Sulfitobacter maritimus]NUH65793.1 DMT family transporter [Sulfitobacter maritimus]
MRIFFLTTVAMVAFAANSILTRMAVEPGHIDPAGFALLRVAAGAAVLTILVAVRGDRLPLFRRERIAGALSLALYMIGFSLAYLTLDAGLGALILFGVVQIAMFGHGALVGSTPTGRQVSGAAVAFSGLILVLWPSGGGSTDLVGAGLMALAGLGWAAYTIIGRGAGNPLAVTAANFLLCLPLMLLLPLLFGATFSTTGIALAVLSGGVTSGLGYALWYVVLKQIDGGTAAVAQLSVPIIAILGGVVMLGEAVSATLLSAAALVLGGILWALSAKSVRADHR